MAGPVLTVQGLNKRYGSQEALAGIDLEVGAGQLVGSAGRAALGYLAELFLVGFSPVEVPTA
jgi:ABC-type uncharacterized transport system ATPase subunit